MEAVHWMLSDSDSKKTYISVLKAEVEHLKSQVRAHDTGHIHTTIGTLEHRIRELESK
jgi:hypothetical protein